MLSIDVTYVAYYGEREELVRVQGAPEDKSYDWCYKFATANVVCRWPASRMFPQSPTRSITFA